MPDCDAAALGTALLTLARNTIGITFGITQRPFEDRTALHQPGAVFVTLTQRAALRGCIGTLLAYRPLIDDVRENARAAAFSDPRFPPVEAWELEGLRVEVSLLGATTPLFFRDQEDALAQLNPKVDGIVLRAGNHRATFLPQVWEELPEPSVFMAHLKRKAGLPADYWGPDVTIERYAVEKWKEAET